MSTAPPHPEQQPVADPLEAPETAPAQEEVASETLYIQNLNESIQIPGAITTRFPLEVDNLSDHFDCSAESIFTWSL